MQLRVRLDPGVSGIKTTSQISLFYYVDDGFKISKARHRSSQLFQTIVTLYCHSTERVALALERSRSMLVF